MAIEDAAVLGNLLSRISEISQLGPLLKAYQDIRIQRTAAAQAVSRAYQRFYHLPDGPEQRQRDENLKKAMAYEVAGNTAELRNQPFANQKDGQDKANTDMIFGYDADVEVDQWWASHGKELEALASKQPCNQQGQFSTNFQCLFVSACICPERPERL